MTKHRIPSMSFASADPLCIAQAERKGRTKAAVDEVVRRLAKVRPMARILRAEASVGRPRPPAGAATSCCATRG